MATNETIDKLKSAGYITVTDDSQGIADKCEIGSGGGSAAGWSEMGKIQMPFEYAAVWQINPDTGDEQLVSVSFKEWFDSQIEEWKNTGEIDTYFIPLYKKSDVLEDYNISGDMEVLLTKINNPRLMFINASYYRQDSYRVSWELNTGDQICVQSTYTIDDEEYVQIGILSM